MSMDGERLEQELRDYLNAEVKKVEPSPEWWNNVISRVGEQKPRSRPEKPARWKFHPSLIGVPLSIFLLVVLVGSLFAGMGGMAPPPPPAPAVVSDQAGGAFLVWLDQPYHQYEPVVRAQHVDGQGNRLWGEKGKEIAGGNVGKPYAVGDGNGGVIIAWGNRNGSFMKRLDSAGETIWTLESFTSWLVLRMVADGSGGAILLLNDVDKVYVQKVSGGGVPLWGEEGVPIGTGEDAYHGVSIDSDGRGGAVVVWQEKSGTDMIIRAQRVSAEGKTLWADGGVTVTSMAGAQGNHQQVISDGTSSFIVAWDTGSATPDTDVYVQKLDEKGNPLWGEDGVLVCKDQAADSYNPANMQSHPQVVADGTGGVIVTWHDRRRILNREIFAQRISTTGEILWAENGVWLWDIPADYPRTAGILDSAIIADGTGSATIVWTSRGTPEGGVIYAQRLSPGGNRLWSDEKVYDSPAFQSQGYSVSASDGRGGIIIGSRVGEASGVSRTNSVYAQRIDSEGSRLWGEGGLKIQKVPSALTVQFIAAGGVLATILVLIGVFRRNGIAGIFTAIMPVLLGIAGLFSILLVIGPFGYTYGWAYIPDTPLNQIATFAAPLMGLAIGAVGVRKKTVTLWVMVPVIVFCAIVTAVAGLVLVF